MLDSEKALTATTNNFSQPAHVPACLPACLPCGQFANALTQVPHRKYKKKTRLGTVREGRRGSGREVQHVTTMVSS